MLDIFRDAGLRSLLAHARQSIPTQREATEFVACYFAALALAVGFTVLVGFLSAQAQERHHPPQHEMAGAAIPANLENRRAP